MGLQGGRNNSYSLLLFMAQEYVIRDAISRKGLRSNALETELYAVDTIIGWNFHY